MIRAASLLALACLSGCGAPAPGDDLVVVADGKEDNYFSPSAREYFVDGVVPIVLDAADLALPAADRLKRATALRSLKNVEVGWFLHVRLIDKSTDPAPHGDANAATYPGFHAIVRDGEYVTSELTALPDGKTFTYPLRLQVAGANDLLDQLPGTRDAQGKLHFALAMGKVPNADLARLEPDHEWFRDDAWDSGTFDPSALTPDQLESLDLAIEPQPASEDAYLDTNALLADDGKLTIDVLYGWDYWNRYDISNARSLYESLVAKGFASPAESFEAYAGEQGPLTKTVKMKGRDVPVEVRIFHGAGNGTAGLDPETIDGARAMEQEVYGSLARTDVIAWNGHSGNYYGFALSDWKVTGDVGSLEYPQLSAAKMPSDRYQIVVASGCDTFSIGQAFRDNVYKKGLKNLDVITSNSFSSAGANTTVNGLLGALFTRVDGDGAFTPEPISAMLNAINRGGQSGSMFGLHGVDDDPLLHPFASLAKLGGACTTADDCGGIGNDCVATGDGDGAPHVCAVECTSDRACPGGYKCRELASAASRQVVTRACTR